MGRLTAHSEYSHTCPSDLARVQAGTEDQSVSPFSCFLWAARTGTAAAGMLRSQGIHLPTFQREPGNTNDGSARQRAQADPKGNDLQTKGKIGRLGSAEAGAGCQRLAFQCSLLEGRERGGGIVCLFCFCSHLFIYLFTFAILILSRFSQVKREWLWVKHTVREETWLWQVFTAQVYFQEYLMNQE